MKLFAAVALAAPVRLAAERGNPISRIVELLSGLKEKVEEDLKKETDVYETYECWYKGVTSSKGASNEAAQSRIDSLTSYIEDIEAGRIEFTTERVDLEKQVKELQGELAQAQTLRDQESADFQAADEEMQAAISALDDAIEILSEGTEEDQAEFLQAKPGTKMLGLKWNLRKALEVGKFLSASDAKFMENVLDVETKPDWKKLNRKATFKMKYHARSKKIQDTLKSMRSTFKQNLKEAEDKEVDSIGKFEQLKAAKEQMLEAAETALTDMTKEGGARGLSKDESQKEIDALTAQVAADGRFIEQVEASYQTKSGEWTSRKELRQNEILAIGKGIAILHSDDARDTFKDSFKSQGYSLLQMSEDSAEKTSEVSSCRDTWRQRSSALHQLAAAVHDPRVSLLALAADTTAIDRVCESIDGLVSTLEGEEETDLQDKEQCETDLASNFRDARTTAVAVDDRTEDVDRAKSKIEQINTQIQEREEVVKTLEEEKEELIKDRGYENAKFEGDKIDDQKAVELLGMVKEVMGSWKTGGGDTEAPSLLQTSHRHHTHRYFKLRGMPSHTRHLTAVQQTSHLSQEYEPSPAGEAPPPPPATWDTGAGYEGAEGESQGIMGILTLVKEDVEKDIALAEKQEADAVTAFDSMKSDIEATIAAGGTAIDEYKSEKADQEGVATDNTEERASEKSTLDATMLEIQNLKPGCDFILVNYEVRVKKRHVEIDGLKKAKAILQGGDFSGGASFLQGKHRRPC